MSECLRESLALGPCLTYARSLNLHLQHARNHSLTLLILSCSFLSSQISQRVLRPALVPQILLSARNTLFPNNALAPARPIPTAAEAQQIKRECATTIVDAIPETARNVYFATKDRDLMREDVEATLDLFCDPYINKHLIVSIVELLVVRLFPETAEDAVDAY